MSTVLEPPKVPFAQRDGHERASFSSFRGGRSNAPSVTGSFSSLRAPKKAFLVTSFFSRSKNRSKLAYSANPEAETAKSPSADFGLLQEPNCQLGRQAEGVTSVHSLPQTEKASTKFMRRLTTKLRSNTSPLPPPLSASPAVPRLPTGPQPRRSDVSGGSAEKRPRKRNSILGVLPSLPSPSNPHSDFIDKDARMAALRARGLVPQLTLREQEAQMDARNAPSRLSRCPEGDEQGPSAADRIKEAWAVKNRELEQEEKERMKSFKFGGTPTNSAPSSPIVPSPKIEEPPTPLSPSPLKLSSRRSSLIDAPPTAPPRSPLPSTPSTPAKAETDITPKSDSPATTPSPTTPTSMKEKRVPPPLILRSRSAEKLGNKDEAASVLSSSTYESASQNLRSPWLEIPLPPSPIPPPSPSLNATKQLPPSPISLTFKTPEGSPTHLLPQPRERLDSSAASEVGTVSSFGSPPSLSSSVPTLSTLASSEVLAEQRQSRSRSRTRADTIPMIVENVCEEVPPVNRIEIKDASVEKKPTVHHHLVFEAVPERLSPTLEEEGESIIRTESPTPEVQQESPLQQTVTLPPSPGKERRQKRKSIFGAFKRANTVFPDAIDVPSSRDNSTEKKKSINLRRAFTSTPRPKSSVLSPTSRTFNASRLPPSPRLPHFTSSQTLGVDAGAQVKRRVSVFDKGIGEGGATMHNRASIIMEVNKIQDEESQRLTENAFLV